MKLFKFLRKIFKRKNNKNIITDVTFEKIKELNDLEKIILEIIKRNKTYINSNQLILELKSLDKEISAPLLRLIIQNLRLNGHKIIANNKGYYFTDNKKEIDKYVLARIAEIEKEKRALYAIQK